MKGLHKVILLLLISISASFLLFGCAGSQKAVCTIKYNGSDITLTLTAEGNKVTDITQVTKMVSASYTQDEVNMVKGAADKYSERYKDVKGISYQVDEENDGLTETIQADVSEFKVLRDIVEKELLPVKIKDKRLPFKETVEDLKAEGWTVEVTKK